MRAARERVRIEIREKCTCDRAESPRALFIIPGSGWMLHLSLSAFPTLAEAMPDEQLMIASQL
jgi:hypothetical protein